MDRNIFTMIEGYMRTCMGDSAHDQEHIYRVLSNALLIAQSETTVDYDVLICACLLHDIARPEQIQDPSLCHAKVGSEKAYDFLIQNGFDTDFAHRVRDCIRTHRFRKNDPPQSLEAKILFDADKLDVTGAVGIARTLVYKGTVSDPLYTRTVTGEISDGTGDEAASFFQEYKFKLEKLYDRFYTEMGGALAAQRKAAAVSFYENLYHEVSQFDDLGKARLQELLK